MTEPAARLALLDAARAVQRAATAGDIDALHDHVCRLRNSLVERAQSASGGFDADDVQHRLARHGQQRLMRFLDDVLSTTHEGPASCTCLVRSAELRSMLIRQLRLEAHVTRSAASGRERTCQDR
jgi:hypothetical protein